MKVAQGGISLIASVPERVAPVELVQGAYGGVRDEAAGRRCMEIGQG